MKKIISLFFVILMAISVVACGFNPVESTVTTTQKSKIERGSIVDGTYVCETLGIAFEKPAFWQYYTDEEIAQLMNLTVDSFLGERFEAILDSNVAIYDMMVQDRISGTNVAIGYENLKISSSTSITESQYIEAAKQQLKYSAMSPYVSFPYDTQTVKLGNIEFTRLVYINTMYGYDMIQAMYVRKLENYMGFVTITINDGYTLEDVESMFH